MIKSQAKKRFEAIAKDHTHEVVVSQVGLVVALLITQVVYAVTAVGGTKAEYAMVGTMIFFLTLVVSRAVSELSRMNAYKRLELELKLEEQVDPVE